METAWKPSTATSVIALKASTERSAGTVRKTHRQCACYQCWSLRVTCRQDVVTYVFCFLCWQPFSATKKRWPYQIKEALIALISTESFSMTPCATIPVRKDTGWVCHDPWHALPPNSGQRSLLHVTVSKSLTLHCESYWCDTISSNNIFTITKRKPC